MYRVSKLLQKLFGEELGDGGDIWSGALVALEGGFIWAIENEDGVNRERNQSEETIVEGAKSGIRATCSCQRLPLVAHPHLCVPLLACIWKSHIDVSIAMRSGRPVSSNFSSASFDRAMRLPGPISL
jgi:hypothetical protein